jgi:hypothetical protein
MFGLRSNIDQVVERFKGYGAKAAAVDPSEALLVGVNAAAGQMKFRIFNQGLDAEGDAFGKYMGRKVTTIKQSRSLTNKEQKLKDFLIGEATAFSEYELKRLNAGRQIKYKDLEFTGSLRRGIVVLKDGNTRVVCVIPNESLFKIAKYQEEQISKFTGQDANIFTLSKEERELMRTNIVEALKQIYVRVLNS